MTNLYFLAVFQGMCQEGNVTWYLNEQGGGYIAQVNGTLLHVIGSETGWIMLTISRGFKRYTIREPYPHISESPLGRFINFLRKKLGLPAMNGPETSDEIEKSTVRAHLMVILKVAGDQFAKRYSSGEDFSEQFKKNFSPL